MFEFNLCLHSHFSNSSLKRTVEIIKFYPLYFMNFRACFNFDDIKGKVFGKELSVAACCLTGACVWCRRFLMGNCAKINLQQLHNYTAWSGWKYFNAKFCVNQRKALVLAGLRWKLRNFVCIENVKLGKSLRIRSGNLSVNLWMTAVWLKERTGRNLSKLFSSSNQCRENFTAKYLWYLVYAIRPHQVE